MPFDSRIDRVLHRLSTLHPKLIDLSLTRVQRLLEKLGNPEKHLPPQIHVAGTNGKGSTIAFLRSILEEAGYKIHIYTSPHLVSYCERIRLAGKVITEEAFLELLNFVEKENAGEPITIFEITTVAAFIAFASTPADLILLETGLGGRLDSTNVIKSPTLSVLTPISIDHQTYLGKDLSSIASEKAGIIKPSIPCVVARQPTIAMQPILARSQDLGSPLYIQDEDWFTEVTNENLLYKGIKTSLSLPLPNLVGQHQIQNAGLALATIDRLNNFRITKNSLAKGITSASWPARLQRLSAGPLFNEIPKNWELWLDGGHNPSAGRALADFITVNWYDKPLHLIVGMLSSKDCKAYLSPLVNLIKTLHTVTIQTESTSMKSKELAKIGYEIGIDSVASISILSAIKQIKNSFSNHSRIIICGSLYLAGEVLRKNR